ncbi:MAG: RNA polymerase sigma factor [Cyclobacteriaceae bacterium]
MSREEIGHFWDQFVKGDKEAFGNIYKAFRPILTFYCYGLMNDRQFAENCSSEALIKTYNHSNPSEIQDLRQWLFTVAKNQCISQLRKDGLRNNVRQKINDDETLAYPPQVESSLNKETLDEVIKNELDEQERNIWRLHTEGYSNSEMAEILNMNEKTVANKKSEIRSRLKIRMKKFLENQEK